ncbi:MAG: cytidylate kinase-like family protein [Deltaproteobacteria bacterium]|jgi:cytidylate kinase|nr:cytidylate kinase-like family protein [Deltaproteobacteria bacterium]
MAILTVSREFGSGGREIGRAVAESLHYAYVDKDTILQHIKGAGGKWEEWGKGLDEHCPTVWEKYDRSFKVFAALIESAVLEHALHDRVVIMGRGGNYILKDLPHVFRIRVVAPFESRIDRIIRRDSVDREMAVYLAEKTDRDRDCFIYSIYGKRWDDPEAYDAVYNTGDLTPQEIVAVIRESLAGRESLCTEEVKGLLRIRAAAARLRVGLYSNRSFFIPTLDVETDGQNLILKGIIHNPTEHKKVEEEAKRLAGETPLKCILHYRK